MKIKNDEHISSIVSDLKNEDTNRCPSSEQLVRYSRSEMSEKELEQFEGHLDICPMCTAANKSLLSVEKKDVAHLTEWAEIERSMDKRFSQYINSLTIKINAEKTKNLFNSIKQFWNRIVETLFSLFKPPQIAYAGGLVLLAVVALYGYAYLSRPAYFKIAQLRTEKMQVFRSSSPISQFEHGLKALTQGQYRKAIQQLETFKQNNSDNYAANYYLGLAHLSGAEVKMLGFSYRFDNNNISAGIKYLQAALQLSAGNNIYRENCFWYLGKAYVMMGDMDAAKQQFQNIISIDQLNLMRKRDAREILLKLK